MGSHNRPTLHSEIRVEQRGIEPRPPYAPSVVNGRVNDADQATQVDQRRREVSASRSLETDGLEGALAEAIRRASTAGQWDIVARLAKELDARRLARSGNVVSIVGQRPRRGVT
jgi:hypothetical protein